MRIIAGTHRSRVIKTLSGTNTRPTSDKAKGAVFSKLGSYFNGGTMLDLFSGSGSMGYEAISRGMEYVILNDFNKDAVKIIQENVHNFKMDNQCMIWNFDYKVALNKCNELNYHFNIIYLDPPYALGKMVEIIHMIDELELLKNDGILIIESDKKDSFANEYGKLRKEKEATYGISRISYYRREEK